MLKPPSSSARRNKLERHEDGAHWHDEGAALHGFPFQASDGESDRRTLENPRSQVNRVSCQCRSNLRRPVPRSLSGPQLERHQCTHTAPIDTPSTSPSPALTRASNTRLRRKSAPRPSEN